MDVEAFYDQYGQEINNLNNFLNRRRTTMLPSVPGDRNHAFVSDEELRALGLNPEELEQRPYIAPTIPINVHGEDSETDDYEFHEDIDHDIGVFLNHHIAINGPYNPVDLRRVSLGDEDSSSNTLNIRPVGNVYFAPEDSDESDFHIVSSDSSDSSNSDSSFEHSSNTTDSNRVPGVSFEQFIANEFGHSGDTSDSDLASVVAFDQFIANSFYSDDNTSSSSSFEDSNDADTNNSSCQSIAQDESNDQIHIESDDSDDNQIHIESDESDDNQINVESDESDDSGMHVIVRGDDDSMESEENENSVWENISDGIRNSVDMNVNNGSSSSESSESSESFMSDSCEDSSTSDTSSSN